MTYSQADLVETPTSECFADKVLGAFGHIGARVTQWVCSREDRVEGGVHYHMAVKLSALHRWLSVKAYLSDTHGIVCHFSDQHSNYYTAWRYVIKEDLRYVESADHPDLLNPQDRRQANSREKREMPAPSGGSKKKKPRLTPFEVSEIILEKGLKTRTQLLALANEQKLLGKTDLAEFIVNRGPKCVADTLEVLTYTAIHYIYI